MRSVFFAALLVLVLPTHSRGQLATQHGGCQPALCGSVSGYAGPGDLVSGAAMWWGLRAYSKAMAVAGIPAINVRRASDNTTTDIVLLNNGNLDVATAATFCASTTCLVTEMYDQTGHGYHAIETFAPFQSTLTFSCLGTLPCLTLGDSNDVGSVTNSSAVWPVGTWSAVAERTALFTSTLLILADTTTYPNALFFGNSPNQVGTVQGSYAGWIQSPTTVTDGVFHVLAGVLDGIATNGSYLVADGTAIAGTMLASTIGSQPITFGASGNMNVTEGGFWPSAWSSAQWATVCHNQYTYYATSVPC